MTGEEDYGNKRRLINIVSMSIILVLGLVLIDRIQRESRALEQANFKLRLSEIRAMLLVKNGEAIAMGNPDAIAHMGGQNPMEWMQEPPGNYQGVAVTGSDQVEKGHWVFDPQQGVLAYRIEYEDQVMQELNNDGVPGWIRFKVEVVQKGPSGPKQVSLIALDGYTWNRRQ